MNNHSDNYSGLYRKREGEHLYHLNMLKIERGTESTIQVTAIVKQISGETEVPTTLWAVLPRRSYLYHLRCRYTPKAVKGREWEAAYNVTLAPTHIEKLHAQMVKENMDKAMFYNEHLGDTFKIN